MGNESKPLLPDSGLPIDEEVKRNLEALYDENDVADSIRNIRELIEPEWDKKGVSKEFRKYVFKTLRKTIFPQLISDGLKEEIRLRRERENNENQ